MVTYTGGFCGTFILMIIPATLVSYARERNPEEKHGKNHNKSTFKHKGWVYLVLLWSAITIISVVYKIAAG